MRLMYYYTLNAILVIIIIIIFKRISPEKSSKNSNACTCTSNMDLGHHNQPVGESKASIPLFK